MATQTSRDLQRALSPPVGRTVRVPRAAVLARQRRPRPAGPDAPWALISWLLVRVGRFDRLVGPT